MACAYVEVQPSIGEFLVALFQFSKHAGRLRMSTLAVLSEVFTPCCEHMINHAEDYLQRPGSSGQHHAHERYQRYDKAQIQSAIHWYVGNESRSLEEACEKVGLPRTQSLNVAKVGARMSLLQHPRFTCLWAQVYTSAYVHRLNLEFGRANYFQACGDGACTRSGVVAPS